MPSSVLQLVRAAGLEYGGVVGWGQPVPVTRPGVYAVSLQADPESIDGTITTVPISPERVTELLDARPELTLDGDRPDGDILVARISEFWLPDENVIYVGLAGTSLANRAGAYYSTKLGRKGPHAGGWFIKLLRNRGRLHVHFAAASDPNKAEYQMLEFFVANVSPRARDVLRDPVHPFPFANLEWPKGVRKDHGIRKATGQARSDRPRRAVADSQASDNYPRPPRSRTDNAPRISQFLQDELRRRERSEVAAVEAARWLDLAGLLRDSHIRRGLPLRDLLRAGLIQGQRQEPNSRWFIDLVDR